MAIIDIQKAPKNVVVNGSGTIGRGVIVEILKRPQYQFNIVAVNDVMPIDEAAQMLEHIFRQRYGELWRVLPSQDDTYFSIKSPDGSRYEFPYFKTGERLPWDKVDANIDIALECSGHYRTREKMQEHVDLGADKVLLSARSITAEDVDRTVVFGINQDHIRPDEKLISNSSCTTNAASHAIKVVEGHFGFAHCNAVSVHVPLNRQYQHRDGASSENGYESIFGIANTAITRECSLDVLAPRVLGREFENRIMANTVTVPIEGGSLMQMDFIIPRSERTQNLTKEHVHALFEDYALMMPHEELFTLFHRQSSSSKAGKRPHSAIVDTHITQILHGPNSSVLRLGIWHDTTWGFAPRMLDVARHMTDLTDEHSPAL